MARAQPNQICYRKKKKNINHNPLKKIKLIKLKNKMRRSDKDNLRALNSKIEPTSNNCEDSEGLVTKQQSHANQH